MAEVKFLTNGSHLCRGLFGTAGDECGRKTYWLRLPGGALVFYGRYFRADEMDTEEAARNSSTVR